ncbi:peptidoglycan-binding protein [Calothrix sp. HK-06]|nr:peptidoglycan-binding protein [Calothrix sp. HK-06]
MNPPTLQRGANGADVQKLQGDLTRLGYSVGAIDGDFGANTEQAVIKFQQDNNLSTDGVVGRQTGQALGKALSQG